MKTIFFFFLELVGGGGGGGVREGVRIVSQRRKKYVADRRRAGLEETFCELGILAWDWLIFVGKGRRGSLFSKGCFALKDFLGAILGDLISEISVIRNFRSAVLNGVEAILNRATMNSIRGQLLRGLETRKPFWHKTFKMDVTRTMTHESEKIWEPPVCKVKTFGVVYSYGTSNHGNKITLP